MTLFRLRPGCLITFEAYGGLKLRSFKDALTLVSEHFQDASIDPEARQALVEQRLFDAPVSTDYDRALLLTGLLDEEACGTRFLN